MKVYDIIQDDIQHVLELYKAKRERLNVLELQAARFGYSVPAEIRMEIDSLKKELAQLQQVLDEKNLLEDHPPLPQEGMILRAKCSPPDWLRYKLVAFDLDGTLLRGYKFSWTLVWEYLGYPKEVQKTGMRRYRNGKFTYKQWCDWACKMFIDRHITRDDFRNITRNISLTNNFYETIKTLKAEGVITAIISGGIDTFIQDKIVDYERYFDYIFINKLVFDDQDRLDSVITTDYDFEGKSQALRLMCEVNNLKIEDTVFIGEGFNDEAVATIAGLSIAYPPIAEGLDEIADVCIKEDDLSLILPHIIKR